MVRDCADITDAFASCFGDLLIIFFDRYELMTMHTSARVTMGVNLTLYNLTEGEFLVRRRQQHMGSGVQRYLLNVR